MHTKTGTPSVAAVMPAGASAPEALELRGHDAVILVDLEKRMSNDDMDLNEKMAS